MHRHSAVKHRQNYYRQIYKGAFYGYLGSMAEQSNEWWTGLGEELEVDIETITDKAENS